MTLSSTAPDFAAILAQAAAAFQGGSARPAADTVVTALLQAEKAAKRQRSNYALSALLGDWRLCFATGTRKVRQRGGIILGKGFYVPKLATAQLSFHMPSDSQPPELGEIANQLQIGALRLRFTGPFRYVGKKNLLAFDFTQVQLDGFGRSIYRGKVGGQHKVSFLEQSIAKQPFFAFFWVTDDLIAARGRGGGLAIWVKR